MNKSKKIMNVIFACCLLVWWISLAVFYKWWDFIASFSLCFAWCWMIWTLLTRNKKSQNSKDEMTRKAWYTALALTVKLYCFILCFVFLSNAFCHFLDLISASDALLYSLYLILLLSRWSYAYYLRHPDKTWL